MHDIGQSFMEMENFEFGPQAEYNSEYSAEYEAEVFGESELQEMAAELLEVSNEQELDRFLGKLIKRAARAAGSAIRSPLGQRLGGFLKGIAKKALPMAGAALGNMVAPGIGGAIGGQLASGAGSMFGLELEGLSQEDAEFELAKQYVRLAGEATKNAVTSDAKGNANPTAVAQTAVTEAAQKHAPGVLQCKACHGSSHPSGKPGHGQSGRWTRRGNTIVLHGA